MSEKIKDKAADSQESELEEGLEETFPASDPPASTQPGDGGHDKDDDGNRDRRKKP